MTIRPLSSRVIFVAPRNMAHRARSRPFPPTFSHQTPLWNRGRAMSIQNSEKFVAFTKTYVENHSVGETLRRFHCYQSAVCPTNLDGLKARAAGAPPPTSCDITRNPCLAVHLESHR